MEGGGSKAANAIEARRMDSKRSKKKKANPLCAVDQIWICVLYLDDHISITCIYIELASPIGFTYCLVWGRDCRNDNEAVVLLSRFHTVGT